MNRSKPLLLCVSITSFAVVGCGKVLPSQSPVDGSPEIDVGVAPPTCELPDATFTHTPGILNMPVTFKPVSGLTYAWTFMNGAPPTSTMEKPTVTWNTAGANTVKLTVTTPGVSCPGATSMQSLQIATCKTVSATATLNQLTAGHVNSGMTFTATVDTTLTGFTVINQLQADNVLLLDAAGTTTLQTTPLPALMGAYVASVSWPLVHGTTYHLVTALNNNNEFAVLGTSPYPVSNGSISVTGSWLDGAPATQFWFAFSNIQTCP